MAQKELIRLTTAGSVDDGKSTLIGRLLFDCNQIYQDHIEAVQRTGKTVEGEIDYSLFTDGLSAEREQGITIDVAYRYFSTAHRRFIVADVPGHEQYMRNMISGASQADVAIILLDARTGMTTQSKQHIFVSSLLGIKHVLIVVNKMDMVNYAQSRYEKIIQEVDDYVQKLSLTDLECIPISALKGDMVVERKNNMPWHDGKTLLNYLETVHVASDRNLIDFRLPIQQVLRSKTHGRHYAGMIESGFIRVGEEILVLPSKQKTTIKHIFIGEQSVDYAYTPLSVSIETSTHVDIGRGDIITRPKNIPSISKQIEAYLCWLDSDSLKKHTRYIIKHMTTQTYAQIDTIYYKINIDTTEREQANTLSTNETGRVHLQTSTPLMYDEFLKNKHSGNFILINEHSNQTVAAGIIIDRHVASEAKTSGLSIDIENIDKEQRDRIKAFFDTQGIQATFHE